ncbi:MAG: hypothetical protein ABIP78_06875 [Pyrinomonadaceae bacterium]
MKGRTASDLISATFYASEAWLTKASFPEFFIIPQLKINIIKTANAIRFFLFFIVVLLFWAKCGTVI